MLARLGPIHAYSTASRAAPLIVAFSTAAAKGSASDLIAQHRVEVKEQTDVRRNLTQCTTHSQYCLYHPLLAPTNLPLVRSFAFFSGAYLGIGQHYIYNVAFTRMFGPGTDLVTVLKKVVIDATIHVPCIYLPLYYPFETIALGKGTAMDGLARYKADAPAVLSTCASA